MGGEAEPHNYKDQPEQLLLSSSITTSFHSVVVLTKQAFVASFTLGLITQQEVGTSWLELNGGSVNRGAKFATFPLTQKVQQRQQERE